MLAHTAYIEANGKQNCFYLIIILFSHIQQAVQCSKQNQKQMHCETSELLWNHVLEVRIFGISWATAMTYYFQFKTMQFSILVGVV